jgi:EAL domain-containing protein (putative c-di-GMP-specific phosphodiesterase class I)/GGDEF domain-containing protein
MSAPRRRNGSTTLLPEPVLPEPPADGARVDRLRQERIVFDSVTGLPLHPFEDPSRLGRLESIRRLGVVYLQIGKFFGFEELYGWELYDKVLVVVAEGLSEDVADSRLAPHFVSVRYNGSDGFFLLFDLPETGRFASGIETEALRLQEKALRRLRDCFGGTTVDMMSVHASSLVARDNPRVRASRHIVRSLAEAARIVHQRQTREKLDLCAELKNVLGSKKLKAAYQPVCHLPGGAVFGYEALIRGPRGTPLEHPSALFAVAQENGMSIELETLCLEAVFAALPKGLEARRLFVNATTTLLRHPVFIDERNLRSINRSHPDVVIEISEREMVGDYSSFLGVLERLRRSGLRFALDDAGSGYSGLEAILHLRPDYIKVADSLVRHLEGDAIKQEIITSLTAIGRRVGATLIAEGIERSEEKDALVALGVPFGQGYLLGRPAFQLRAPAA